MINIDLKKLHTKQLLRYFRDTYSRYARFEYLTKEKIIEIDNDDNDDNIIRAELATREHVLNKKESRAARIARKKSGISRKK